MVLSFPKKGVLLEYMKRKPTILMFEDNAQNQRLYFDAFGAKGFDVAFRDNADGIFVDEVADFAPDIISMDLMMGLTRESGELDGFLALERLKANPRTEKIPVIILTSFFEENKVRRAKELGAVDFFSTPGQTIQKIPEYFMRYLENPKRYRPSHPIFREK